MIRIQRLVHPTKRSGEQLMPGKAFFMRGLRIVNQNGFPVWVDKFTTRRRKKVRRKLKRK